MEANYMVAPTPHKSVGHGSKTMSENVARKKDKAPGPVDSRTQETDLEVLEVKVKESQWRAFSSGMLEGYELHLLKYLKFCDHFKLVTFPLTGYVLE